MLIHVINEIFVCCWDMLIVLWTSFLKDTIENSCFVFGTPCTMIKRKANQWVSINYTFRLLEYRMCQKFADFAIVIVNFFPSISLKCGSQIFKRYSPIFLHFTNTLLKYIYPCTSKWETQFKLLEHVALNDRLWQINLSVYHFFSGSATRAHKNNFIIYMKKKETRGFGVLGFWGFGFRV